MGSSTLASLVSLISLVPVLTLARDASACGASFGRDTSLDPAQTLVVSFANGEERYTLNPSFCGKGAEFGLVLPVPAPPSKAVVLGDGELVEQLDQLSAPTTITTYDRYCPSGSDAPTVVGGAPTRNGVDGEGTKSNQGVDVVDAGKVGFLDYEVIKAESETSLTAYLDANAFPYDSAARSAFTEYVSRGFFFVAFKFSAVAKAPSNGQKVCGSLGPLVVSFPATKPIIPTRIVTGTDQQRWRVYAIADENRDPVRKASNLTLSTAFRGAITTDDLARYPALAAFARAGQRVNRHEIQFTGSRSPGDLTLETASAPGEDYRAVVYRTEATPDESACSGCSVASREGSARARTTEGVLAMLLVGLSVALAKRRFA